MKYIYKLMNNKQLSYFGESKWDTNYFWFFTSFKFSVPRSLTSKQFSYVSHFGKPVKLIASQFNNYGLARSYTSKTKIDKIKPYFVSSLLNKLDTTKLHNNKSTQIELERRMLEEFKLYSEDKGKVVLGDIDTSLLGNKVVKYIQSKEKILLVYIKNP